MDPEAFEDANAACGLLPGPASTQMAIYCAYRGGGPAAAVVGGLGFIMLTPGTLSVSKVLQHPLESTHVIGPRAGSPTAPAP